MKKITIILLAALVALGLLQLMHLHQFLNRCQNFASYPAMDRIWSMVDCQRQEMFEKYGLDVELVDFAEDKEVNAAFASGDMDAANLATHTAIKLHSVGLNLKLVLLEDVSTSADAILGGEDITSIADLKGRSVSL